MTPLETFVSLLEALPEARQGSMFGYPALCIGRKPFAFFHAETGRDAAFKLPAARMAIELQQDGYGVFDPAGKGKPMKSWLQVPFEAADAWAVLAEAAFEALDKEVAQP